MLLLVLLLVGVRGDLRQEVFGNAGFVGNGVVSVVEGVNFTTKDPFTSVRWTGMLSMNESLLEVSATTTGEFRCWIGGHVAVDTGKRSISFPDPTTVDPVINITTSTSTPVLLRCEFRGFEGVGMAQLWVKSANSPNPPTPLPRSATSPFLSPSTSSLLAFHNSSFHNGGWDTWWNLHMGSFVFLPWAVEMRHDLVNLETGAVLGNIHVYRQDRPALVRPGLHSTNFSEAFAMEFSVSKWGTVDCEVGISASNEGEGRGGDLAVLVEANGADCGVLGLRVSGLAEWGRPYTILSTNPLSISLPAQPKNFTTSFFPTWAPSMRNFTGGYAQFNLSDGAVLGFSSGAKKQVAEIRQVVAAGLAIVEEKLERSGVFWRDAHTAQVSVIGWNTIYSPYYTVLTPVSRGWDFGAKVGADCVVFDWDNLFLSQMAMEDEAVIAWSNLLAILRAGTAQPSPGFVPNFAAGPIASYDRTEPYVGGMAALDLWARSCGLEAGLAPEEAVRQITASGRQAEWQWAVETVLPNLVAWSDWVVNRRTSPMGVGAVVLGSDIPQNLQWSHGFNTLQSARYESGLDNSPAYDGNDHQCCGPVRFDNETSHHMNLVDVGMSALFIADTRATAALATLTNQHTLAASLMQRVATASRTLSSITTDPTDNRLWNTLYNFSNPTTPHSFYKRDLPTLFYPLLAAIPNRTAQALLPFATALQDPDLFNLAPLPPDTLHIPNVMPGVHGDPEASSAAILSLLWNDASADNALISHPFSMGTLLAQGYRFIRTEAIALFPPPSNQSTSQPFKTPCNDSALVDQGLAALNTTLHSLHLPPPLPLWRFFSAETNDTLTAPSITQIAQNLSFERIGLEGYCLDGIFESTNQSPLSSPAPLTLWYSNARKDFVTCGSTACVEDAERFGYTVVSSAPLCYGWDAALTPAPAPLPSIARNDSAFQDNSYWRGRVWGPMLYLVYQGMWQYDGVSTALDDARKALVAKARATLLTNFSPKGHVMENYNGTTGYGADTNNADPFYHWGALAGYIGLREHHAAEKHAQRKQPRR